MIWCWRWEGRSRNHIPLSVPEASEIKASWAILFKVLLHVREPFAMMFGCKCLYWNAVTDLSPASLPEPFSLPAPVPKWPEGMRLLGLFFWLMPIFLWKWNVGFASFFWSIMDGWVWLRSVSWVSCGFTFFFCAFLVGACFWIFLRLWFACGNGSWLKLFAGYVCFLRLKFFVNFAEQRCVQFDLYTREGFGVVNKKK